MAKRRNLHEDSQDPDEPASVPPAGGAARDLPPMPRRGRDVPPGVIPPPPTAAEKAASKAAGRDSADPDADLEPKALPGPPLPSGFFGSRALFLLLRLGSPQPIRLSFVIAASATEAAVEAAFRAPGISFVRLAPGVFDVDLASDRLERFLLDHHHLFRRVEAPGWLQGEIVATPADRAEVTISIEEPLTVERKRDLDRLGFHLVAEGPGEIRGVVLGKNLCDLVAAPWLGPIEVRKIHQPKK